MAFDSKIKQKWKKYNDILYNRDAKKRISSSRIGNYMSISVKT